MGRSVIDISGQRFARLTVIERAPRVAGSRSRWRCACDCGRETVVEKCNLRSGSIRSCGCVARANKPSLRHGHTSSAGGHYTSTTYKTWQSLIQRCTNPKSKSYADYGGRGIEVCDRWLESFDNFLYDMGEKPSGVQIERKNNDGPYSLENCRWATVTLQARNRRSNVLTLDMATEIAGRLEHGETPASIARRLGVSPGAVGDVQHGRSWRELQPIVRPAFVRATGWSRTSVAR